MKDNLFKTSSHYLLPTMAVVSSLSSGCAQKSNTSEQPNILIIQVDEQSFKTLSCYRNLMGDAQAYPWGGEAKVETPNIDRLAQEGALCNNYYASSPVSTPSRASFQTGLYPVTAGAPINGMTMRSDIPTFAEMLRQDGYQTDYVGKWHLAGTKHTDKLFVNPGEACGYMDRTYIFETNHNKWYKIVGGPTDVVAVRKAPEEVDPRMYSTDFLTDRCIEMLDRDKDKRFCMMLSIPDPHSPNIGREPYTSQFADMKIEKPASMSPEKIAERPVWAVGGKNEAQNFNPKQVREYFAMIQCIDDNVGRIMNYLDENELTDNTIVVFTSDHGDMMYEHHKMDKGNPYQAAAKIPFIIRYPNKIKAGKIIEKSYTTCDFAPTLLGLVGAPEIEGAHGINDAATFFNDETIVKSDRIVYLTDSPFNVWTAAIDGRYKLVLSCRDTPWLFDLERDPDEYINFYSDPAYAEIANKLQAELLRQMELYHEPALDLGYKYCLSADDTTDYVSPYEGKSLKEIVAIENETLSKAISDIQERCFR